MSNYSQWVDDVLLVWRAGRVASLMGPPGIGKSSQVDTLHRLYWGARAAEMPLETVMLSLSDPTDLVGILTVDEKSGETVRLPPGWVKRIVKAGGGTVFFDEATLGTPATWTAMLRVLLEKHAGDVKLPDAVRFVLASNPVEMTNAGNAFPPAGANRVTHFTVESPEPAEWGDWKQAHAAECGDEFDRKAATIIAAFVYRKGMAYLLNVPTTEEKRAEAWASPRSVHAACDILAAGYRDGSIHSPTGAERVERAIAGTVGAGWASNFATFLKEADIPDPREVLLGREEVNFNVNRPDRARPIAVACANEAVKGPARDKPERAALVEAAWGVLLQAADIGLADTIESAATLLNNWRQKEGGGTTAVGPKTPNEFKALREVFKHLSLVAAKK